MTRTRAIAGEQQLPEVRGNSAWALVRAIRPQQWPKNGLVFAALIFSLGDTWTLDDPDSWIPLLWRSVALFGAWCLASSATYLFNDIRDVELDRLHPRKRFRPIASGALSVGLARATGILFLAVAIPAGFALDLGAGLVLAGYVVVMTGYSMGLKRLAIVDVFILCSGVVGRAISGALGIDVEISPWLYVCSSFGALFFATSKRWAEFRQLGESAAAHRPALAGYSIELLNQMLFITGAAALVSYAVYTVESMAVPDNGAMALTVPFVVFALFRYLMLLDGTRQGDAPDQILFTDPGIVGAVAGFVVVAFLVLAVN